MKPKSVEVHCQLALAIGLRGLSRVLSGTGWALEAASRGAYRLADKANRSATRIKARSSRQRPPRTRGRRAATIKKKGNHESNHTARRRVETGIDRAQ